MSNDDENFLREREMKNEMYRRGDDAGGVIKIIALLITTMIPVILWLFGLLGENWFSLVAFFLPCIVLVLCIVDAEQKGGR